MNKKLWPRLAAGSGVLYVVLVMVGNVTYEGGHPIGLAIELAGMMFFFHFLGYLWSVLRQAEGGVGWMSATVFGSGLVEISIKLGSVVPILAANQPGLSPELSQVLQQMGGFAFIIILLPIGIMMGGIATVILMTRCLPRWLGVLAAIVTPACLANGMYFNAEFGPAFLLFLLWVVAASIVLVVRSGEERVGDPAADLVQPAF